MPRTWNESAKRDKTSKISATSVSRSRSVGRNAAMTDNVNSNHSAEGVVATQKRKSVQKEQTSKVKVKLPQEGTPTKMMKVVDQ